MATRTRRWWACRSTRSTPPRQNIRAALACAQTRANSVLNLFTACRRQHPRCGSLFRPDSLGGRELLFSIIHDISERKRAEEQLRFTASVFEHAHEGIMITDANAQIVDVNRTFTGNHRLCPRRRAGSLA